MGNLGTVKEDGVTIINLKTTKEQTLRVCGKSNV